MANIKSAKKRAIQTLKKRQKNLKRKTALKTAVKKVVKSIESKDVAAAKELLRDAEARLARATGKGVLHKNTARRKTSRLAKRVAQMERA